MKFTQEHEELRRTIKNFVEAEINPHVSQWEEDGIWPAHEVLGKMGELGLLGITKSEKFGGMGLDWSFGLVAAEALGNIDCGGVLMGIGVHTDMATPALAEFGTDELREKYLVPAITGEMVSCIGVSEPQAGSDVAALTTNAVKDGDDYVINGTKMWITNSTQADWMCLLCNTSEGKPHMNKSQMIIPMDAPGVSVSPKFNKLGMRSSDTAQVFLDNVRIPQANRIGGEGMGFIQQMVQFQHERVFAASGITGLEKIIEGTIEFCKERKTFGQPIIDNQYVHFRLAELKTEVELLRSLLYRLVDEMNDGGNPLMLNAMVKLKMGRLSREVSDACLQYFGGQGFMWDHPIALAYRDGRLTSIGGGADEIMLGIICKAMDTLPRRKK